MVAITPDTSGNDVAFGTPNPDTFGPSPGNDQVFGGAGGDTLRGGRGNDDLFGGPGPGLDTLSGGRGNDFLSGGAGIDDLHGGPGADVHEGGPGADFFFFRFNQGPDTVVDFEPGTDQIFVPNPSLLGTGPTLNQGDAGFEGQNPNTGVTVIDIDGGAVGQEDLVTLIGLNPGQFLDFTDISQIT